MAINTVATMVNMVSQLLSVALISRLLRPEEIGLFSVASAFAALLIAVRDLGIGLYILQERDLHAKKLNSALTILAISSLLFGAVLFASSSALARYYGEPALDGLIRLISANFLFVVWIGGMNARLQRELAYGVVAQCSIVSTLAGSASGVLFAHLGLGPSSLAYALLVTSATQVFALACFRPGQIFWTPTLVHAREIIAFGWKVLVGSIAQQGATAAPDLIIGKALGMEPVAVFNRAMAIRSLVATHLVQIIQSTMVPKFAAEHRDGLLTADAYLARNRFVTGLLVPIYAISVALAEPLVLFLFGSQWTRVIPVAQVLCAIPLLAMPYALLKTAATASGQVGPLARLEVSCLLARVAAIAVGAQFGLFAIASLMLMEVVVYGLILSRTASRLIGLPASTLYRSCVGDYALGLACALVAWASSRTVMSSISTDTLGAMWAFLVGGALGVLTWLALIRHLNLPLAAEMAQLRLRIGSWIKSVLA